VLSTTVFEALYNFGSNQLNLESALMLDLRFLLLAVAAPFAINANLRLKDGLHNPRRSEDQLMNLV
jgi:hypothetical protein